MFERLRRRVTALAGPLPPGDERHLKDLRGVEYRQVHRNDNVIISGAEYLRKSKALSDQEAREFAAEEERATMAVALEQGHNALVRQRDCYAREAETVATLRGLLGTLRAINRDAIDREFEAKRETERLREALEQIAEDTGPPYPDWAFFARAEDREHAMQNAAREALSSVTVEGVRLVDANEVADWLRDTGFATFSLDAIHARFLARFGGGDER